MSQQRQCLKPLHGFSERLSQNFSTRSLPETLEKMLIVDQHSSGSQIPMNVTFCDQLPYEYLAKYICYKPTQLNSFSNLAKDTNQASVVVLTGYGCAVSFQHRQVGTNYFQHRQVLNIFSIGRQVQIIFSIGRYLIFSEQVVAYLYIIGKHIPQYIFIAGRCIPLYLFSIGQHIPLYLVQQTSSLGPHSNDLLYALMPVLSENSPTVHSSLAPIQIIECSLRLLCSEQCDQMARLFVKNLSNYTNVNLPHRIIFFMQNVKAHSDETKMHAPAADCCRVKNQNFFYILQHHTCLLQQHADSQQILWPSEWAVRFKIFSQNKINFQTLP